MGLPLQVAGILCGDTSLLGRALGEEVVVEGARGPLIPGFAGVKQAAMDAGAFGCTISGAGPTVVAVVASQEEGQRVGKIMAEAFSAHGNLACNSMQVVQLDTVGARVVTTW